MKPRAILAAWIGAIFGLGVGALGMLLFFMEGFTWIRSPESTGLPAGSALPSAS